MNNNNNETNNISFKLLLPTEYSLQNNFSSSEQKGFKLRPY